MCVCECVSGKSVRKRRGVLKKNIVGQEVRSMGNGGGNMCVKRTRCREAA